MPPYTSSLFPGRLARLPSRIARHAGEVLGADAHAFQAEGGRSTAIGAALHPCAKDRIPVPGKPSQAGEPQGGAVQSGSN